MVDDELEKKMVWAMFFKSTVKPVASDHHDVERNGVGEKRMVDRVNTTNGNPKKMQSG